MISGIIKISVSVRPSASADNTYLDLDLFICSVHSVIKMMRSLLQQRTKHFAWKKQLEDIALDCFASAVL